MLTHDHFYNTNDRMNNDYILISLLWKPCIEFYLAVRMRACLKKRKLFTSKAPKHHNRKNLSIKRYLNELKSQHFLLSRFFLHTERHIQYDGGYTSHLWTPNPFLLNFVYVLEVTVVSKY